MSFMDDIGKIAGEFGGAQGGDGAAQAARSADPGQLADGLTQNLGNFDNPTLVKLGETLLHHFTQSGSYDGDANSAADEAGVAPSQVAGGNPSAIGMLLQFAKNHPQVLQQAAGHFMGENQGGISQMAPGLLQGIMGKFGA